MRGFAVDWTLCFGEFLQLDEADSGLNEPLYREFQRYKKNIVTRIAMAAITTKTEIIQNGTTCGNECWAWTPVGMGPGSVELEKGVADVVTPSLKQNTKNYHRFR